MNKKVKTRCEHLATRHENVCVWVLKAALWKWVNNFCRRLFSFPFEATVFALAGYSLSMSRGFGYVESLRSRRAGLRKPKSVNGRVTIVPHQHAMVLRTWSSDVSPP